MEGTVEVKGLGRLDSGDLYDALEIFVQLDTLNVLFGKKISELKNQKSFSVEILRVGLLYLMM